MATGIGVDPTINADGTVTSGTTAQDTRLVWGALYKPGIMTGCTVTTSPSAMTYTVAAGAVMVPYSTGEVVPTPVRATTLTVPVGPASGTRTDYIYAKQNIPSVAAEGHSNVTIEYGTSIPARAVELARFQVPAQAKNTDAGSRTADKRFAVPVSGPAGILHQWTDTYVGRHTQTPLDQGHKTLTLTSDRRIRISITSMLYAENSYGFDQSKYCEWFFIPHIDNVAMEKWTTPGLHQSWATYTFEGYYDVLAGQHTFFFRRGREVGPGMACTHYGRDPQGYNRLGTRFTVEDVGPVA